MVKRSINKVHQGLVLYGPFKHYFQHFDYAISTITLMRFNILLEQVQRLTLQILKLQKKMFKRYNKRLTYHI